MISTPNFLSIFGKNSARAVYSKVISSLFPESAHPEIAGNRPLAAPQTEELMMSQSTNMLIRMGNLWARVLGSKLRRRSARPVETLESRTLLATLVSANQLTYQDADGDNVEVTFSKPILTPANVNTIFTFNSGTVNGSNATKQQLLKINLVGAPGAAGTTIITKAVRSAANGGDGFAAIGNIDATGIDISTVTIDGDLGRILAGDATTTTQGLGALTVHSMGQFGTSTGAPELYSLINGKLLSLKSKTDLRDIFLETSGSPAAWWPELWLESMANSARAMT
jgi:hypothetical protein